MHIRLSDHFTCGRLFRFVLPSILMMVFMSVYGVVDGFFISNYGGKVPFAAVNVVMPFVMVLGAFGFMLGSGGSALVAKILGQGRKEAANRAFSMLVSFTFALGSLITAVALLVLRPVCERLGATPEMMPWCLGYGRILIVFNTAFMLQCVFQSLLITAERPALGLYVMLGAGCANMALDALFVGVFSWGVRGAAWATIISQLIGFGVPLAYFLAPNSSPLRIRAAWWSFRILARACANGAAALFGNIATHIVSMAFNYQLMRWLGAGGVAAYGVMMYVSFVFVAILIGYSAGISPVISFAYGAKNRAELHNLHRKSLLLMAAGGMLMAVLAELLAEPMASFYVSYDTELLALTIHGFRLFSLAFVLSGLNIYASNLFTALNNGAVAATISFLRTLVFELLAVFLLPLVFGINGIWGAVAAAELAAFGIASLFLVRLAPRYGY